MPTLPYPTLNGTCVSAAARPRDCPRGGSGRARPVSRSKTGWGLRLTPVASRWHGLRACVSTQVKQPQTPATRATPRPAKSDERIRQNRPRNTREQETATNETVALINCCREKLPALVNPWTAVRFENSKTILNADSATAMGEYYFTTLEGTVAKVEYTFQYKRGADGNLKIVVHHSSLPYSP